MRKNRRTLFLLAISFVFLSNSCSFFEDSSGGLFGSGDEYLQAEALAPPTINVIFAVDQSGSMRKSDNENLRFDAVRYAIDSIRMKGTDRHSHRVGLVQFGEGAPQELAWPLSSTADNASMTAMKDRLKPINMPWTDFNAALDRAELLLESGGAFAPNQRQAIVIFTDGSPDDARKLSPKQYFDEIQQKYETNLKQKGVSLYVIALDNQGNYWQRDEPEWREITGGRAFKINSVGDLKSQFNTLIHDILQLPLQPRDELSAGITPFMVRPYLEQLEFHIMGQSTDNLELLDPNGNVVQAEAWKSPEYTILSVVKPLEGEWSYNVTSPRDSTLNVYRSEVPVRPQIILPRPVHAAGRELEIRAVVKYLDGSPLTELDDYPIRLTANFTFAEGIREHMTLERDHTGQYVSKSSLDVAGEEGRAELDIVLHAGTSEEYNTTIPVHIEKRPYFEIDVSHGGWLRNYGDKVAITATLMEMGEPLAAEEVFDRPNAAIRAEVSREGAAEGSESIWLDPVSGEKGKYTGEIEFPVGAGYYVVTWHTSGNDLRTGNDITQTETYRFRVSPSILDRVLEGGETALLILMIIGGLLVLFILYVLYWTFSLPNMRGNYLVVSRMAIGKKKGIERRYRLSGKFKLIKPGKLFFVHKFKQKRRIKGRIDRSKEHFAIRYISFPFISRRNISSGGTTRIGKYTFKLN